MRIECGSTRERKVRSTLMFLLVSVFCLWFARDGWIKYPEENLENFLKELPVDERDRVSDLRPNESVGHKTLGAAHEAVKRGKTAESLAAFEELYGGPPSYKNDDAWYYFGTAFMLRIVLKNGRPTGQITPSKAAHSEMDLLIQRGAAVVLLGLSVVCLWQVVRVFATRLVLSEAGLTHKGRGQIPWSAMKRLDSSRFDKKGWVDLYHEDGEEQVIRLDEYHIAAFDDVMAEICNRKGFVNPMRKAKATPDGAEGDAVEDEAGNASSHERQDT